MLVLRQIIITFCRHVVITFTQRWKRHNRIGGLASYNNVRIAWLAYAANKDEELLEIEKACILHFKPALNQTGLTKALKEAKISFYLTQEQVEKLDDLAYEHKKRTGKRINRNDIVRHLIDRCRIEDLSDLIN